MARNETFYIYGTYGDDLAVLDAAAVDALEYSAWDWATAETVNHIWSGNYSAFDGNDTILRDRPGGYRANISPNGSVSTLGDAFLYGGSGTDQVAYSHASGSVHVDLGATGSYGTAVALGLHGVTIHGGDRLYSIENASGSHHDDIVEGSGGANRLFGLDGDDEMLGHGGNDSLRGGNGNDSADGGSGNDTVIGDDGNDVLRGGDHADTVQGGNHNDTLYGDAGNDFLYGDGGRTATRSWAAAGMTRSAATAATTRCRAIRATTPSSVASTATRSMATTDSTPRSGKAAAGW
jgi:Ca2+-binding RTX toxin-like protein